MHLAQSIYFNCRRRRVWTITSWLLQSNDQQQLFKVSLSIYKVNGSQRTCWGFGFCCTKYRTILQKPARVSIFFLPSNPRQNARQKREKRIKKRTGQILRIAFAVGETAGGAVQTMRNYRSDRTGPAPPAPHRRPPDQSADHKPAPSSQTHP